MIGGNYWGGYGKDYRRSGHFAWEFKETDDGWHYYGVDWSPEGYRFYADRKLIGTVVPPGKGSPRTHGQRHGKKLSSAGGAASPSARSPKRNSSF